MQKKSGVDINDDVGLEREADLFGQLAVSHANARINDDQSGSFRQVDMGSHTTPIVQRIINIPFNNPDKSLLDFYEKHANGMAPGKKERGIYSGPLVKVDEDIAIIAHGNGECLMSSETGGQGQEKFMPEEFSQYLSKFLPKGYSGQIIIWSCRAATPYKIIDKQAPEELADESFITVLKRWLGANEEIAPFKGTISGPIGYVTLDKPFSQAAIYEREEIAMAGNSRTIKDGFITAGKSVDLSFYKYESDESGGESYGGSSSEASEDSDSADHEADSMQDDESSRSDDNQSSGSSSSEVVSAEAEYESYDSAIAIGKSVSVKWLNIIWDQGGMNANAYPEKFAGMTTIKIIERKNDWFKVEISSSENRDLNHPGSGKSGWAKNSWLSNAR